MAETLRTLLGFAPPGPDAALAALLDSLPQGAALLDAGNGILHANAPLRDLLGPLIPLRPGTPALALFDPPARESVAAWLAAPSPAPLEAPLATAEGTPPTLALLRTAPLPGGLRTLLAEDLSERTRRRAEAESGECLRAVGQLAGGIAHDVNNLLAIILAATEAAAEAAPATREALRPAQDAAARGAALVRRLLAVARRQRLDPRILDLDEAVAAATPMLRSLLGRTAALRIHPAASGRRVRVDPTQLDQILLNLAANARDAMAVGPGAGEGTLTVATSTAIALAEEPGTPDPLPPGRWTVLDIADTGPGIPPDLLQKVFEPFFTTRADQGGTGLGLATVHGIVRQSGGALQVESRPGHTRFRIHLPRHEGPPEPDPPRPAAPTPAARPEPPTPRHILLVDDEAPLRRLAASALERAGHTVTQAEDGETALELLESGPLPAALVSDIAMPGLDGIALARAVRARHPNLPVILTSGYAESALGTGMTGEGIAFLPKPYRPAQLLQALADLP